MVTKTKVRKRKRRHSKVRTTLRGKKLRPRLCVYRSNTAIYGQIIDDRQNKTLVSVSLSDKKTTSTKKRKQFPGVEGARDAGKEIAKHAVAKKIKKVVFDRSGFKYAGCVRAFAEGARDGGLIF